jgi:hypothetical protein
MMLLESIHKSIKCLFEGWFEVEKKVKTQRIYTLKGGFWGAKERWKVVHKKSTNRRCLHIDTSIVELI